MVVTGPSTTSGIQLNRRYASTCPSKILQASCIGEWGPSSCSVLFWCCCARNACPTTETIRGICCDLGGFCLSFVCVRACWFCWGVGSVRSEFLFSSATPTEEYTADCTSVYWERAEKIYYKKYRCICWSTQSETCALQRCYLQQGLQNTSIHFHWVVCDVRHVYQQQDVAIFLITGTSCRLGTVSA
jgi:hypothetical protein